MLALPGGVGFYETDLGRAAANTAAFGRRVFFIEKYPTQAELVGNLAVGRVEKSYL